MAMLPFRKDNKWMDFNFPEPAAAPQGCEERFALEHVITDCVVWTRAGGSWLAFSDLKYKLILI